MEATAQSATSSNQVQQFNLKWTNHTYNMLQTFTEQLLKENFVDCTLTCDGQFIRAHKMILSGCSHYFEVSHNLTAFCLILHTKHFKFFF